MAETAYKKPVPRIDEETRGYWEACRRHELVLQRCGACNTLRYYPRAVCPECLSDEVRWEKMSGRGTVYTFTVTYQNQAPGFRDELPYVLAYVTLDEGPQMLTNVVGCKPDEVKVGMPVEVTFEDVNEDIAIPRFKPIAS